MNGESPDRAEILAAFDRGEYNVLCNSMLLTEGWDCPSVNCVVVLRPTKVRSLYSQMVGRGTRLFPGKTDLLLLDFLWHTERHELCRPAHLVCETAEVAESMTESAAEQGGPVDILEAAEQAESDVVQQREESLAKQLAEMKSRKRRLVDPLQFELSIQQATRPHSAGRSRRRAKSSSAHWKSGASVRTRSSARARRQSCSTVWRHAAPRV